MGCGTSAPVVQGEEDAKKHNEKKQGDSDASAAVQIKDAGGKEVDGAKGKSTRARRLSFVTGDANGVANVDGGAAPLIPSAPTAPRGKAESKKTRARRLSIIQNPGAPGPQADDNANDDEEGEEEEEDADGGLVQTPAMAASGQTADSTTLKLAVACMSRAGKEPGFKKTNQDNCFAFEKYIAEDRSLFGAMDGHGPHGHLVSGFVKQHLPIILVNHMTMETDVEKALSAGFVEVDKSLGNSRIDCEFSGSTAVVSYLKGKTLTTAWVGDSRGVLGCETSSGVWESMDLTTDHKPTIKEEQARILASNGRVERLVDELGEPMGPHRVWLQYAWIPGLAMSRALGDVLAHQVGVSSVPDCTTIELEPKHKFMILASDGVWEFISSKEAVEIVSQYDTVEEGCRQLVDEAYQRWLIEEEGVVDDITAVIVKFLH